MDTADTTNITATLNALQSCSNDLQEVALGAQTAETALPGARATRAGQVENAIAGAEQVTSILVCDQRAVPQEIER